MDAKNEGYVKIYLEILLTVFNAWYLPCVTL